MVNKLKKTLVKSALIVTFISLISKFTGFLREVFLASNFGASKELDSFLTAETIVSFLSTILLTILGIILIPLISKYIITRNKKETNILLNKIYTNIVILSIILTLIGFIFLKQIVLVFAPNFNEEMYITTTNLTLLLLPTVITSILVFLNNSVLQSHKIFYVSTMIGIPLNLTIIIYLNFFSKMYGIKGLSFFILLGNLVQLILQIPFVIKLGYKFELSYLERISNYKELLNNYLPIIIGALIMQLFPIIEKSIASSLPVGSITALSLSSMLILVVFGIVTASISSIFFTELSHFHVLNESKSFNKLFLKTVNIISILIVPISMLFAIFRVPIIEIFFMRGKFDSNAVYLTSNTLLYYSISLFGLCVKEIAIRTIYVINDSKSYIINSIVTILSFAFFSTIFSKSIGVYGLALGYTISVYLSLIFLLIKIQKYIVNINYKELMFTFIKVIFSSICMGLIASMLFLYLKLINNQLINLMFIVSISLMIYIIILEKLNVEEVNILLNKIFDIIRSRLD